MTARHTHPPKQRGHRKPYRDNSGGAWDVWAREVLALLRERRGRP